MSGLMHIHGGRPRRAATARFAPAALLAAGFVLCTVQVPAYADPGEAQLHNQPAQDKKSKASRADKAAAKEAQAARDRARKAIRADDYRLAERLIRDGLKTRKKAERDAWHLVESELAFARKQYAGSGLIAMRIVILRPKSRQVGAALYRVARAYEALGRSDKAMELYDKCKKHRTTRSALRKKAEKRLGKLTGQQPKP